jgi:hypothetical protein
MPSGTGAALDDTANASNGAITRGNTTSHVVCTFTRTRRTAAGASFPLIAARTATNPQSASGVVIPALTNAAVVTLGLTCRVTATGMPGGVSMGRVACMTPLA